jgi:hypothetical protein
MLESRQRETFLESIGKGEASDTATSDDDFQVICHGSGICSSVKTDLRWREARRRGQTII